MQFKNIFLTFFASAALVNAVAIPVTTTDVSSTDPNSEEFAACVSGVASHRRGTHLPTDADKASYAKTCEDCFNQAKDVCGEETGDCVQKEVAKCLGTKGGAPQTTTTAGRKNKRDDAVTQPPVGSPGAPTEPKMKVPHGLAKPAKREVLTATEPVIKTPPGLKNSKN